VPLLPAGAAPDFNDTLPLAPATPPSAELTATIPLLVASPRPDTTTIDPPVASKLDPEVILMRLPAPTPVPTEIATSPPRPTSDDPDAIVIAPLGPADELPERISTFPLIPRFPESPLRTETEPLDVNSLPPLRIATLPPEKLAPSPPVIETLPP
jgi:hypothetical protein